MNESMEEQIYIIAASCYKCKKDINIANLDIAVEKCLVFLSNLASTYYTDSKWKPLNAMLLHQQSKNADNNTFIYTKIIDVLTTGTSTGAFIEVDNSYQVGFESKKFQLTDTYLKEGLIEYIIKDYGIIRTRNRIYYQQLCQAMTNPIQRLIYQQAKNCSLLASNWLMKVVLPKKEKS